MCIYGYGALFPIFILITYYILQIGANMMTPGIVYVKFLKPILYTEAASREDMSRYVHDVYDLCGVYDRYLLCGIYTVYVVYGFVCTVHMM